MLISVEELRQLSVSTWHRVIRASAICLVSMSFGMVPPEVVGFSWHLFIAVPLMLLPFAYVGLSLIMTSNYRHVLNRGNGRDPLPDSDNFFRRLIIREEIK